MHVRKKVAAFYLLLLIVIIATLSSVVGFLDGRFLFCSSMFLLFGLGCVYEYCMRDELLKYSREISKSEAEAEFQWGFYRAIWKSRSVLAAIMLIMAVYFLLRYGAHS